MVLAYTHVTKNKGGLDIRIQPSRRIHLFRLMHTRAGIDLDPSRRETCRMTYQPQPPASTGFTFGRTCRVTVPT